MTRKKIKLDAYEQEIEENLHKMRRPKNHKQIKTMLVEAAKNYFKDQKQEHNSSVTIKLPDSDLAAMKRKAEKIGMSYETYIKVVLHRDAVSSQ